MCVTSYDLLMLCHTMLYYAVLYYVMLYYAILYCVMLCHVMLCLRRHESITKMHFMSTVFAPFAFVLSEYAIALLWSTHPFADRAATYFLTKTMLELPVTLVQTLVQFIMCYNMIGLQVLHHHYISKDTFYSHCYKKYRFRQFLSLNFFKELIAL